MSSDADDFDCQPCSPAQCRENSNTAMACGRSSCVGGRAARVHDCTPSQSQFKAAFEIVIFFSVCHACGRLKSTLMLFVLVKYG